MDGDGARDEQCHPSNPHIMASCAVVKYESQSEWRFSAKANVSSLQKTQENRSNLKKELGFAQWNPLIHSGERYFTPLIKCLTGFGF